MRKLIITAISIFVFVSLVNAQRQPLIAGLTLVSQLPSDIPQRITGMAFDGEKLWFSVYLSRGHYATFESQTGQWTYSDNETQHAAISKISQPFTSVSGIAFNGRTMWLGGSYGASLGSIDLDSWNVERSFSGRLRPEFENSQSYSGLAHDGTNLWAAWHMCEYRLLAGESQALLKINQDTGQILARYDLPAGSRADSLHGLTFDGQTLWHIKDRKLSAISLEGKILVQYELKALRRPSGLAWDGQSLWIVEFDGKLWKMPLV